MNFFIYTEKWAYNLVQMFVLELSVKVAFVQFLNYYAFFAELFLYPLDMFKDCKIFTFILHELCFIEVDCHGDAFNQL